MKKQVFLALFVFLVAVPSFAQQGRVPAGKRIYIEAMENDLDSYLRAEFVKQRLPLMVVLQAEDADLVLTGSSTTEEKRAWHEGWLTTSKDKTAGSLMVVDKNTHSMLWAGEAGDRSLIWGSLARGGQRKVASRLIGDLKKAIRN